MDFSKFYYTYNGFIIHNESEIPEGAIIRANARICGGKGGFGSMLRAIGSQIEKTTNKEMCRDLSGRRMRDVNLEKKLKEWLDKADERKKKQIEQYLEKRKKRKQLLEQGPMVNVDRENNEMQKLGSQIISELKDAMEEAFKKYQIKPNQKSKVEIKPKKIGLVVDSEFDSEISSEDSSSPRDDKDFVEVEHKLEESTHADISLDIQESLETTKQASEETEEDIVKEPPLKISKVEEYKPIDLEKVKCLEALLLLDTNHLKRELSDRGLKSGGTLMEKASRLFSVRGLNKDEYPSHVLLGAKSLAEGKRGSNKRGRTNTN